MNKIRNFLIIAFVALCIGSCGESFLEEVDITKRDTDFLDTPEGLKSYAMGLPAGLRVMFAHESCIAHFALGTDEFSTGGDDSQEVWNSYTDRFNSPISSRAGANDVDPGVLWDDIYIYLAASNRVIAKGPSVLAGDPALNEIMGAAYFMRAWNHFILVQQWGDVPMMDYFVEGFTREFERTPRQTVLQFVIDDFQRAYDLLEDPAARVTGKIYKVAAAHYLAKALLYRQSEINSEFREATKTADLNLALQLCDYVIATRGPLTPNFADLHNFKRDNDPDVEALPEILLSCSHGVQQIASSPQNYISMFYISLYQNWYGMVRDIGGGREYQRAMTTDYSIDVFDLVNDSRFWKSFRTTQKMNNIQGNNKRSTQLLGSSPQENGQIAVMYIMNKANDYARFQSTLTAAGNYHFPGGQNTRNPLLILMDDGTGVWDTIRCHLTGNVVPNVIPRYRTIQDDKYHENADLAPQGKYYGYGTSQTLNAAPHSGCAYPSLSKFMDGTRPQVASNGEGNRDAAVARLAETFLIAAEVKVRQGDFTGALPYINAVRERATYKDGEDRGAYVDGAQAFHLQRPNATPISSYSPYNTYYISNGIPETTAKTDLTISSIGVGSLPAEDEAIITTLGISGDFDRMICLILNERTRELCGEMQRWDDLARTKTLLPRVLAYNHSAIYESSRNRGIQEFHYFRPIPQRYLDAVYRDGRALTAAEKNALKNDGYN